MPTVAAPAGSSSNWLEAALGGAGDAGTPLIIKLGTGSALVPRWTPAMLSDQVAALTRVYVGSDARFGPYYDESRPFARAGLTHGPSHNYSEVAMATKDVFYASSSSSAASSYAYYSGEVERDLPAPLLEALRPLEAALIARRPTYASVNLWLGSKPVVAPCHYDAYHNAMVQLSWRKHDLP